MGHLLDRLAACEIIWPLVRSFGRLLHLLTMCRWPLAVLPASCSFTARLLACGPLARSSFNVAEPQGSFFLCHFVRCIVVLHHVVHTRRVLHIRRQLVSRKNVRPRRHGRSNFLVMASGFGWQYAHSLGLDLAGNPPFSPIKLEIDPPWLDL